MNPTNALLPGISNAFKPVHFLPEPLFPDTSFAVLDAWAKEQEVKEEETATIDDFAMKNERINCYYKYI